MNDKLAERELENVNILAERIAFLHYAFTKTLLTELPKATAEQIINQAIAEYGRMSASAAVENIKKLNMEPTLNNFSKGKDLPSVGWKKESVTPPTNNERITRVTLCPLAEAWRKIGGEAISLGRYYCYVDQAKFMSYGKGYKCFHDKNMLDGDICCIIRIIDEHLKNI